MLFSNKFKIVDKKLNCSSLDNNDVYRITCKSEDNIILELDVHQLFFNIFDEYFNLKIYNFSNDCIHADYICNGIIISNTKFLHVSFNGLLFKLDKTIDTTEKYITCYFEK